MRRLLAGLIAAAVAGPAPAMTFFSLGGSPDPGRARFETSLVTFDAPLHAGVVETDTGPTGLYTLSQSAAAAPAGDTSIYKAIGSGGSATFDFRSYFASRPSAVRSISVYVGSVDLYNYIDVLDHDLHVVATISGSDLPGNNGDQGAAVTNRRLYINFDPSEAIGGLAFRSAGVAFEFDDINASSAVFGESGRTPAELPLATNVPEPSSWAMLVTGLAVVGVAMRRRLRTEAPPAAPSFPRRREPSPLHGKSTATLASIEPD